MLLYYYRSWAAWTILYSISFQYPPILNSLKAILPRTSWGSAIHTFLVIFQCTFHLLKKVRYIIIITTAVLVCNWQHLLLITIVIIIPITKIVNHHNQCIRCQSFVQSSTHDVASQDSSYIFPEKGNKTTKQQQQKNSEGFNTIKVELPPFFSLIFCTINTRLVQLIPYKMLRRFCAQFRSNSPISFQPIFHKLFVERWVLDIFLFLYLPLPS